MSFTDAWVWWIGTPLIVTMVIWHVLRTQATQRVVPSLYLWQFVVAEQTSRRPFTPPTPWWLLLVRVILTVVLACAAAGPVWVDDAATQPTRIIVIDTSASMLARTTAGTRISLAKQRAHALIDTAPVATRFTIVQMHHTVQIQANQMADRAAAHYAVDAIEAIPVAGDFTRVMPQLQGLDSPRSAMYVISDDHALWDAPTWPASWRVIPIGGDAPNQSIQGLQMETSATGWTGTVYVASDGRDWPAARLLQIRDQVGTLYAATYVWPRAGAPVAWSFALTERPDVLVASLAPDEQDTLAADDSYWWRASSQQPLRVFVQSSDSRFLPAALRVLPNVTRVSQPKDADIAIVESLDVLTNTQRLPTWLIAPPSAPIVTFPQLQPILVSGDVAFLNQDIAIQHTQIITASVVTTPVWAQRWLYSAAGTHAYAGSDAGVPQIVMGFLLTQSDLPLRADFPILVRNVLRFLAPQSLSESMQTGLAYGLDVSPSAQTPQITTQPAFATARIERQNDRWYVVDINTIGAYRIDSTWYVANMLAPWESATQRPATDIDVGLGPLTWAWPLRNWFMLVAVVLIVLERFLTWYTRRTT